MTKQEILSWFLNSIFKDKLLKDAKLKEEIK